MDRKIMIMDPPEVSTIITALKCQLAKAFVKIEKLKAKEYPNNPIAKKFKFNKGTGVFSGQTQVINGNRGTVSAIIPFTGFMGSTLTPDLGAELKGTAEGKSTRTFSITPSKKPTTNSSDALCKKSKENGVAEGDFLITKMVSEFRASVDQPLELVEVEENKKKAVKTANTVKCKFVNKNFTAHEKGDRICKYQGYEPNFKDTELKFETTFVVAVGFDGGVTSTVMLSNPRLTSLGPGVTADYDKTRTYKLTVTLPMGTNETTETEPRRVTYCDVSKDPKRIKLLCVEEVYDEDRYNVRLDGLNDPLPYGIRAEAVNRALASLLTELQKNAATEGESLSEALANAWNNLDGETRKSFDKYLEKAVEEATDRRDNALTNALGEALKRALSVAQTKEMERPVGVLGLDALPPIKLPALRMELPESYFGPIPPPPGY